jgi:hypothetical protein
VAPFLPPADSPSTGAQFVEDQAVQFRPNAGFGPVCESAMGGLP